MIQLDPAHSTDECCCFVGTTAALLTLGAALVGGTSSVIAANKGAHAATAAAKTQADAATHAGDLSAKAAADQLAFTKEQAAQDQANWERSQQFNVDQFNQRQDRLAPYVGLGTSATSTLANLIGGPDAVAATQQRPTPAVLPPVSSTTKSPTTLANLTSATGATGTATPPTTTLPRVGPAMPSGGTTLQTIAAGAGQAASPAGQGWVAMIAPTGEQQLVPPNMVSFYESHGARRAQGAGGVA